MRRIYHAVGNTRIIKECHLQIMIGIFKTQRKLISLQNIKIYPSRSRMLI